MCAVCGSTGGEPLFRFHPRAGDAESAVVRCAGCGLRRLDPRPTQDALPAFYGGEYYAYAGRRRARTKQAVWDLLRDVGSGVRLGPLRPLGDVVARRVFDIHVTLVGTSPRVLDIGCGFGDLLIYLKERGADVQGVEFDAAAAEVGARHGVPIHVGGLDDLRLPPASVDVAILQHSLEHVPDPRALLRELARIVRPGGTLHLALPNGAAAGLQHQRDSWGCLFAPEHFWYFDAATLGVLLQDLGFAPTRVSHHTIWANHRRLWQTRLPEVGRLGVLREALPVLLEHLRRRDAGDILRLVAERR